MSQKSIDAARRRAVRLMLGSLAAVPVVNLVGSVVAEAAELPPLSPDDPQAKALQYVHDATQANRTDKGGVAASEQFCSNCQFIQASEGEWRPCQIFPGKAVNENGWCVSWVHKA